MFFVFNKLDAQIDTLSIPTDSTFMDLDSTFTENDSLPVKKRLSPDALTSSVKYISQDSIIINLGLRKIFLFEDAKSFYEDIELNAGYIEFGFVNSELYAAGVADSSGNIHGDPIFKQGETEFSSQEISYNFNSKKGKVTKVITQEADGFVHGYYVKHVDEKTSYIRGGRYTTCNLEEPHFHIHFGKGKVIQDDKIVTGPAYLSFGNIPSPLALPFALFPLQKERASGIILPTIGESTARGFVFEDFGYYWGINDNIDILFSGDITTRGSWAAKAKSNYVFRYKCNGIIELGFSQNVFGERGTKTWAPTEDFRVVWKHNQDPKSHPTTRFSAYINVISRTYNKYNPTNTNDYLSNQFNSSLSFSTNAKDFLFFDAAAKYQLNTYNGSINLSLPDLNLSIRQIYPFRNRNKAGKLKWYDNISLKWGSQMSNQINTTDSLFLRDSTWKNIESGIQHTIPLNIPVKLGKGFNWNTNATLVEKWYLQRNQQEYATWIDTTKMFPDTLGAPYNIFERGFYALHDVSLSTSINTKIYWMLSHKKWIFKARLVMTPDLSFTFKPNLSGNTYNTYYNSITGNDVEYSYYAGAMYGGVTSRMQAITRFTVNNNLEFKVRSKKDTITGTRKITIFDNLSVSCGYDFAADSLQWQPLTINGRTSLFSFLNLTFRFNFDPYIIIYQDHRLVNLNQTEQRVNNRPMRFSGSDVNVGLNWNLNNDFFKGKKKKVNTELENSENDLGGIDTKRHDFSNPWNVALNYTFQYITKENLIYYEFLTGKKYDNQFIQTISVSADVNITRKWKLELQTNFDIQQKEFSYTKIKIIRDLHCWEMWFEWEPFGWRRGWRFQINVKAPVLQDLKLEMKQDFRDNLY